MGMLPGDRRAAAKRDRWDSDFYVEPAWCVEAFFEACQLTGPIHDPCCGSGTIPTVARQYGYEATGADLVDRGIGAPQIDFLQDTTRRAALVFNAPYKLNELFIAHALTVADEVAALVRVTFLNGQERYRQLYATTPPTTIFILAQRPSMPPGGTDIPAKGGTTDYAWLYWRRGAAPGPPVWLAPRPGARPAIRSSSCSRRPINGRMKRSAEGTGSNPWVTFFREIRAAGPYIAGPHPTEEPGAPCFSPEVAGDSHRGLNNRASRRCDGSPHSPPGRLRHHARRSVKDFPRPGPAAAGLKRDLSFCGQICGWFPLLFTK
jgi:hypothetical protein